MTHKFDWSRYEEVPTEKSSFDWSKYEEVKEEPSRTRSLLSAFPKGLLRGGKKLSQLQDPISSAISSFAKNKPDLEEEISQRLLPTQKGQFPEDILETAGELAPSFAMGPGGLGAKAAQVAAGSISKNVLKQMGAPELVQEIGAGVGSLSPHGLRGALSKKIIPSKGQKEVYDFLKGHGFSDKTITPFIQHPKKISLITRYSKAFLPREKIGKDLSSISEKIYEDLLEKGQKLPPLEGLKKTAFIKQLDDKFKKIPYFHQKLIQDDISRLKDSSLDYKSLRDIETAINNKIRGTEGGKQVLGILKEPIKLGQRLISPELYKEKEMMNQVYKTGKDFQKKLSRDVIDKLMSKGEIGAVIGGLLTGNMSLLSSVALKKGSEFALSRLLISPRFQSMKSKLLNAVKKDNQGAILTISTKMLEDLDKFISHKKEETED